MNDKTLEIKLTRDGRVAPNQNVIFNEQSITTPGIAYSTVTGEITFIEIGQYSIEWWVATETTPRGVIEFGLMSSEDDFIRGGSPLKTGQVSGFAAIDIQTAGTTLRLINATSSEIIYSKEVILKAYLSILPMEIVGPAGPVGPQGDTGPTGSDGPRGDAGPAGANGLQGATGPTGAAGNTGPKGDAGSEGPTGPRGVAGTVGTILGYYETLADLEAAHPTGARGDFYYVSPDLYVWDEEKSEWFSAGVIAGPQGNEGPMGPIGDIGPTGPTGPTGLTGADGADGEAGEAGADGAAATVTVGDVIAVPSASPPKVTISGTESAVKLNFEIPTCILVYRASLVAATDTLEIPLKNVTVRFMGNGGSSLLVRLVTTQTIFVDYRRVGQHNTSLEQGYNNGRTINGVVDIDNTILSLATERWTLLLRQQDPVSGFWTLHDITLYSAGSGTRTTAWVTLLDDDVDYTNPVNP